MATAAVEDYLKHIFLASRRAAGEPVGTGVIAAGLDVTPGTVTTMLKSLADQGLVRYERYRGARLTAEGRRIGAAVVRRHRMIELFLVRQLGFDWAEVHDEAERLEHAASGRLVERMAEVLGDPAVDPHGDPIPGRDGAMEPPPGRTLASCRTGDAVVVARIRRQSPTFLTFVDRCGLRPGVRVTVVEPDGGGDVVVARADGECVSLSAEQASCIAVA